MEEETRRRPRLVVVVASPFLGHLTPTLQLATALYAKGFAIAVAHSNVNSPDPCNHPPGFIFLPLSDNLSAIDASYSFSKFIHALNRNAKAPLQEHLTRLITERNTAGGDQIKDQPIIIIYDHVMSFAGAVAAHLNLPSIVFRSCSAAYVPAFLARERLHRDGKFPQQDGMMEEMVPNLHPLRYKDLPYPNSSFEYMQPLVAFYSQQPHPSAIIWNTIELLEHQALSQIRQLYQVPVFAIGPLHKITPSPPTNFLQEDTGCITWLDKQAPKSVIYVSFGSLATLDSKLVAEMAWGLAKSNQPFMWAVRPGSVHDYKWMELLPESFIEETRDRGLLVKWASQKQVLGHRAVGGFWSHCGWNSILESVSEGVPMICQSFFFDQGVNARYVSYEWKIGMELECFERGAIARTIRRLMADKEGEESRGRASDLKEKVKAAIETGGSSHDSLHDLVSFIMSC